MNSSNSKNKNEPSIKADNSKNYSSGLSDIQTNLKNVTFNKDAKVYVPKEKKNELNTNDPTEKLNFNLNAKEYIPKSMNNNHQNPYQVKTCDNEEDEGIEDDELDMIVNDLVENDVLEEFENEESDDEKWFPKYKDCECCKGLIYKCKGSACINMGVCYCKMKDECDDD